LTYLKHLRADHLKIDMEFVRELTSNEDDERVVRGIVGLARDFNQTTVAEGIEDEPTLAKLRELGVDGARDTCSVDRPRWTAPSPSRVPRSICRPGMATGWRPSRPRSRRSPIVTSMR
jgi:predicted signal transduction protein with EAL and GGDEF domain